MFNKNSAPSLSKILIKIYISMFFIICPCFAFALKGDEKQPLQIDADQATLDQKQMVSVFSGNVVITKGTLVVHASKGVASQDTAGDRVLILDGSPVTFVQMGDDGEKIEGQGNNFNYNSKSHLAVLTGRARIKKGKNIVIGDVLTYNSDTQVYSAQSTMGNGVTKKSGGRITVILDQQSSPKTGESQVGKPKNGK